MSDCKIYPADTVDVTGYAWLTLGENIRNGGFPGREIKSIDLVIENSAVVNPPSFLEDKIKSGKIYFIKKTIIIATLLIVTKGVIKISAYGKDTDDSYIDIYVSNDCIATIRFFYYDN